jgi:hypothetical protein
MIYKTYDKWLIALEIQLRQRGVKSVDRIGIDLWEYFERQSSPDVAADSIMQRGRKEQIFFRADMTCEVSYADKGGKYQDQVGLTLPKVD